MKLDLEYNYWKVISLQEGAIEITLFKTGVWQTMPFGGIEISKEEFDQLLWNK